MLLFCYFSNVYRPSDLSISNNIGDPKLRTSGFDAQIIRYFTSNLFGSQFSIFFRFWTYNDHFSGLKNQNCTFWLNDSDYHSWKSLFVIPRILNLLGYKFKINLSVIHLHASKRYNILHNRAILSHVFFKKMFLYIFVRIYKPSIF